MKKMKTIKYPEIKEVDVEELIKNLEWHKQIIEGCLQQCSTLLEENCKLKHKILILQQKLDFKEEGENDEN